MDSDNDGCNDVKEAGYTDANFDGLLGNVSVTVTSSGTVSSGVDGYTTPISWTSPNSIISSKTFEL